LARANSRNSCGVNLGAKTGGNFMAQLNSSQPANPIHVNHHAGEIQTRHREKIKKSQRTSLPPSKPLNPNRKSDPNRIENRNPQNPKSNPKPKT
jgi:hypothetical protein